MILIISNNECNINDVYYYYYWNWYDIINIEMIINNEMMK